MRHALLAASLLILATPAHALLRSPQVPVTGTTLQNLLNAQGQAINVATDQQQADIFWGFYLTRPTTQFFVQPLGTPSDALVVFDANVPTPGPTYTIAPGGLPDGWFTEVGFDGPPDRMIVNTYDANSTLQGSVTYLGLALVPLALATSGPGGVFYVIDPLNVDQRAHVLLYHGTGAQQGSTWLCAETLTEADGGNFDFADAVFLLENLSPTPVRQTTWGALKQRFR